MRTTKIINTVAAILLFMTCCTVNLAQAAPTPDKTKFDHSKTGFILKDVHTTLRCEQCHIDGVFKNTPKECVGCHAIGSRVAATPKPANHVQTTASCDTCHTNPTSFLVKSFKHIGVSNKCDSCHNKQSLGVVSKPANHFPTLLPCESCHTNTNTFTAWKMDHTGLTSGCSTCHNGQFPGVTSKTSMGAHIATTAPCETCHTSTTTFLGAVFDHTSTLVAGNCNSCHTGQLAGVKGIPTVHIPTGGAQCDTCHSTANSASFVSFLGGNYDHVGPPAAAGQCSSCHTGSFPGAKGKPATHVATALQCDACHNQTNTSNYTTFLGATYTHTNPPGVCSSCHNGTTALGKSPTHVATAAACDTCHTIASTNNFTSFLGAAYVHPTPPGVCATCHNGVTAKGKTPAHIATTAACDSCHQSASTLSYTSFVGGMYPHTSPIAACSSCHNGVQAKGKPTSHVSTTMECNVCHTQTNTGNFATFLGAVFAHANPPGVCSSCHNGTTALGKPGFHISTTLACNNSGCHTQTATNNYTTFLGVMFDHSTVNMGTNPCAFCHNGTTAKGKSAVHLATALACDICHTLIPTAPTFLGAKFHTKVTPPGVCSSCHNGTTATGKPATHIPTSATCDSCHVNTTGFTVWTGALYTHPNPPGTCSMCHDGSMAGVKSKPTTHVATTAACDTCHTQANTQNYLNFLGASYTHTSPPGVCANCHNGVTAKGKPALHVLTTAACDVCHTQQNTGNFTSFLGAVFTHTVPPGVCSTCHNGTTARGKTPTHVVTSAPCDTCHTQTNTNNYTTFLGAVTHTPLMAGTCQTCHNGAAAKGVVPGHIPVAGLSCDSGGCHQMYGGAVTTFAGAVMSHAVVTATRCDTCHNGSYTAQGTMGAQAKVSNHIPTTITAGLDCTTCHTTPVYTSATGWLSEKMNHNGALGGGVPIFCVTCHLSGTTYLSSKIQKKSHNGASATVAKDCSAASCHKPVGRFGISYSKWN